MNLASNERCLTQHDALLDRCRADPPAEEAIEPIPVMGMPTCDRVPMLARGLRSYMRNSRDHGRNLEFVVIDDSRHEANRQANRATLAALAREHGTSVSYAGPAEREAFVNLLVRESDVPPAVVRFALLNPGGHAVSAGASRNALLLHSAGDRLIQVDDDTVCNVAPAPNAEHGLSVVSIGDPTECFFFGSPDEARAAVSFYPRDYVGLYEDVLGKSAMGVLAGATRDSSPDLDRLRGRFLRELLSEPCPIVTAAVGVVGDSGFGSSERYFLMAGTARERLLALGERYRRALESRQVVRAAPRTTLAGRGECMGLGLGLDNRHLLPPFLPVLRNQDGVFASVRQVCLPATSTAFLPHVVEHSPPVDRRCSFDEVSRNAGRLRMSDFLISFTADVNAPLLGAGPEQRLPALGRHFMDIGRRPVAEYAARCRRAADVRTERVLRTLEGQPGGAVAEQWRRDVGAYAAAVRRARDSDVHGAPSDLLAPGVSPTEAVAQGQRLLHSYGELLSSWPTLVRATGELRRRGHRLALPISPGRSRPWRPGSEE